MIFTYHIGKDGRQPVLETQYRNGYSITFKFTCEYLKDTHGFPKTSYYPV